MVALRIVLVLALLGLALGQSSRSGKRSKNTNSTPKGASRASSGSKNSKSGPEETVEPQQSGAGARSQERRPDRRGDFSTGPSSFSDPSPFSGPSPPSSPRTFGDQRAFSNPSSFSDFSPFSGTSSPSGPRGSQGSRNSEGASSSQGSGNYQGPNNSQGSVNSQSSGNTQGPNNPQDSRNSQGPNNSQGPRSKNAKPSYFMSWREDRTTGRLYSWQEANHICNRVGAQLVSLKTERKQRFAQWLMHKDGLHSLWTSGKFSNGTFMWGDKTPLLIGFTDWSFTGAHSEPQPDNLRGYEDCVSVLNNRYEDGIVWHDARCHDKMHFLCEY